MFTGTSNYRQLTVNAGATLNLAAASTMSINGDLTNNGMVSGDGTLQLNGTSTQNLTGTGTVHNLKVNNSAGGVTIASGSNKVYVTGVFTPTSGVTITNGNLVFRSTASQEGTVGVPGTCPTEPITGDVTVEKYLPGKRAFRLLSPGVTTTTPINTHWQEGSAVTTTTGYPFTTTGTENPAPGYGTHITGTGGSTNGFDATVTNNASLFTYNPVSAAWVAEANTNAVGNVLRSGEGYRILLRGSRGVDLNNNTATADATTLRTTGTLEVCATRTFTTSSTVPLSAASAGFSLVGNPYWSVVDWHTVSATNLEQTIYYWDPNLAGTSNRGAYVSYNTSSGKSNPSSNITRYIQPGQAFFVRNTAGVDGSATLPTLTIDKDDIVTGTGNRSSIFGRAPRGELVPGGINMTPSTTERIYVSLIPKGRTVSGTADGLLVAYGKTFGMEKGKEDAEKLTNPDENLSADYGGLRHSILGLQTSEDRTDSIPLGLWNLSAGNYTLRIDLEDLAPGREVWIYDRQTKRTVRVTGSGEVYGFTIEGNAAKRDGLVLVVHGRAPLVSQTGGLVLYPNPLSGDRLQVALPSASIETTGGEADWELLNGQGVTVQRGTMVVDGSGRGVMELWGVAGGVYVVRIRTTSGAVFTSKLIKP
jgi:hypothetical protein